jgi:hypothetical protein
MSYGALFCSSLQVPRTELAALLASADALGAEGPVVESARAVYDGTSFWTSAVYNPLTNTCEEDTAQLWAAVNRLRELLGGYAPAPVFPDAVQGVSIPWWGYVGGAIVGLGVLGYFLGNVSYFVPRRSRR